MQQFTNKELSCETHKFDIYVSGDYGQILHVCQDYCLTGFCVSVSKVDYVYTMGRESGAKITLINYPRFPLCFDDLYSKAKSLAELITVTCGQGSYTVVSDKDTYFWSRRKND